MKSLLILLLLFLAFGFYLWELNNQVDDGCVGLHPETNVKNVKR